MINVKKRGHVKLYHWIEKRGWAINKDDKHSPWDWVYRKAKGIQHITYCQGFPNWLLRHWVLSCFVRGLYQLLIEESSVPMKLSGVLEGCTLKENKIHSYRMWVNAGISGWTPVVFGRESYSDTIQIEPGLESDRDTGVVCPRRHLYKVDTTWLKGYSL